MGDYTTALRKRLGSDSELPDVARALLRLGADGGFKIIAWPCTETRELLSIVGEHSHQAIAGYVPFLAERCTNSVRNLNHLPAFLAEEPLILENEIASLWDLRKWSGHAAKLGAARLIQGDKPRLTVWRVIEDYTLRINPNTCRLRDDTVLRNDADHRLIVLGLQNAIHIVAVAPADATTRRAGL